MKRPTIDSVTQIPRRINIPSDTEINKILSIFGYSARVIKLWELAQKLEKIRLSNVNLSDDRISSKFNLKEATVFYLSGKISIDELKKLFEWKSVIERDEVLEFSLVNYDQIETSSMERIFKSMWDDSQEFYSENYEDDCILFASIIMQADIETIEKHVSWIELLHYLLSFLIYPGHILAASHEYQEKFFTLLYKHICYTDWVSGLLDTNSELHRYIQKYFWQLDCIKNQETNWLIATVSKTKWEISRTLQVWVNKELPKKELVFEILVAFDEDPERAAHFMSFRNHMHQWDISHKIRKYEDFWFKDQRQVALSYVSWNLDISLLDNHTLPIMSGDQSMWLFDKALIYYHSDSSKEKQLSDLKKFNKYLSSWLTNTIDSFWNELVYMIIAISLLRYDAWVVKDSWILANDLQKVYLTLLMYPRFLQKAPIEQQNRYFWQLFDVYDVDFLVNNVAVRRYLDNYFGDIPIVASRIKQIEASMATQDNLDQEEAQNIIWVSKTLWREEFIPTYISVVSILNTIHKQWILSKHDDIPDPTIAWISWMYLAWALPPRDFDNEFNFQWTEDTRLSYYASIAMLKVKSLSNKDKNTLCRKAVKIINDYKIWDVNTETEVLLYIILLTKFERSISKRYIDKIPFAQASVSLLLHRGYLDITSETERENFFFLWFESLRWDLSLEDKDWDLWKYLLQYYEANTVIVQNYDRLFQSNSSFDDVVETAPKEKTLFDSINPDTIDISLRDWRYYVSWENIAQEWAQACIVVWNKAKNKDLKDPKFYSLDQAIEDWFEFVRWQVAQIWFIESGKPLTKANYNQQIQSFVAITVPVPKKEKTPFSKNIKPSLPERNTVPKNSRVKTPDNIISPDYEALQTHILLQEPECFQNESWEFIFTIEISDQDLCDWNLSGKSMTRTIVFSKDKKWPLIFLWLPENLKLDNDLLEYFDNKIKELERKIQSTKLVEARKKTQARIDLLPSHPWDYKDLVWFLRSCNQSDLTVEKLGKMFYIWQLPYIHQAEIISSISTMWYDIRFNKWNDKEITHITLTSKSSKTSEITFDVSSSYAVSKMNRVETSTQGDIWVAEYILNYYMACTVNTYYQNPNNKKNKQKIERQRKEREALIKEVRKKLDAKDGTFIDNNRIIETGVDWDNENINAYPILWRIPYIRVSRDIKDENKRLEEYEDLNERISNWELDLVVNNFYNRLLVTVWLIPNWHTPIETNGAYEILQDHKADLDADHDIELRRLVVWEVIKSFHDKWISLQFYETIDFSLRELEKEKE